MNRVLVLVAAAVAARLLTFALFDPFATLLAGDAPTFIHPVPGYQPPLYPLLVGIFGWAAMPWLQTALAIGVGLLTLHRLPRFGMATALAIVTLPSFILYEWSIRTEPLVTALIWVALLLLAYPRSRGDTLLAGLALWLAILARDTFLLLPVALLPFAWWAGKAEFRRSLIAASLALLLVAPFVPVSQGRMGVNLWIGTWERDPSWMLTGVRTATFPDSAFTGPEQRRLLERAVRQGDDRLLKRAAEDRMANDPGFVLASWTIRYPRLWIGTRTDQAQTRLPSGSVGWTAMKLVFFGLNLLVVALGLWGVLRVRHPLFLAPIAYLAVLYIPFHNSETRYSLPVLPFLLWFAIAAADRFRHRRAIVTPRLTRGPTPNEGRRSTPSPAPPAVPS